MAINLNGMTWDQLVALAQPQRDAYMQAQQARGFDGSDTLGSVTIGGQAGSLYLPSNVRRAQDMYGSMGALGMGYGADAEVVDQNFDPWANAYFSYRDPGDDNYTIQHYRGDDGSVGTRRYFAGNNDIGFLGDMAKFAAAATGMYGGINALAGMEAGLGAGAGEASSSLADVMAETNPNWWSEVAANGMGDPGFAPGLTDIVSASGGGSLPGSSASGSGSLPTQPSFSDAGFSAQTGIDPTYTGTGTASGGGMWDTILDKAIDFGTSQAGSTIIGSLIGGASSNGPDSTTTTTRQEIDPRMASILYGPNGNDGFLASIMQNQNREQTPGMRNFGAGIDSYLNDWGTDNFMRSQQAAQRLQASNINAPTAGAASMQAAQVNAPGQNNLNLSPAYQDMVYGQAGNNPYLTSAIQKGINQGNTAFGNMLSDATRNITESILPSIRSGARVSGNYGSDREGIAQGRALDTFNTQVGRAMSQFGQNNTDAAVAAQAGAYDADRNRALNAMSGLGAQQYGTSFQNAGFQQQANQTNAQLQQQAALANQQAQLATNQLNSQNQTAGIGLSSGLLGQAYGYGTNNDSYAGNRLGQTAGLLAPFTGLGASATSTQPLYNNTAGGILGGALAGASLWNAFNPQTQNRTQG